MPVSQPIPMAKIIDALLDENTRFRASYLNRLSDLEPEDTTLLVDAWPKISVRRRQALLEDLEEINIADDLQNFEAVARVALKDAEPGVRISAINILREYELTDLLPTFMNMAEHDPDPNVRAVAASSLGTYVYLGEVENLSPAKLERVEGCLLRIISSDDTPLVHRKALEALGYSSRNEVNGLIEKAYASDDMDWLVTALFAMGKSANSHWKPHVLKMLNDTHPMVRAEAASAAGELEIKESTQVLIDLLDDPDLDVRLAAIWALSEIGGTGVRQALENQLDTTDDNEEADQIEKALENLDFTEEMREISLLEIQEDENEAGESSDDENETNIEDLITEDGQD